jgi:hypothetical protein
MRAKPVERMSQTRGPPPLPAGRGGGVGTHCLDIMSAVALFVPQCPSGSFLSPPLSFLTREWSSQEINNGVIVDQLGLVRGTLCFLQGLQDVVWRGPMSRLSRE